MILDSDLMISTVKVIIIRTLHIFNECVNFLSFMFSLLGRIKYLTLTDPKKVWMPDTFFRNEKTGHFHNILVNNVYIRIFPNGDVLYSIRISLTLSCPMHLKLYPMDRQTCALKIASCETFLAQIRA